MSFGPCFATPRALCNAVMPRQFKSRFGSKLQYAGMKIMVPKGVRFTVSFRRSGLSRCIP